MSQCTVTTKYFESDSSLTCTRKVLSLFVTDTNNSFLHTCPSTAPPGNDGQGEGRVILLLPLQLALLAPGTLVAGPGRRALLTQKGVSHGTSPGQALWNCKAKGGRIKKEGQWENSIIQFIACTKPTYIRPP